MKYQLAKQNHGFTLVELLAAMTIVVIIVMLMSDIVTTSLSTFNQGTRKNDLNIANRSVLNFIRRELSQAYAFHNESIVVTNMDIEYSDVTCPYNAYTNTSPVVRSFDQINFAKINNEIPESGDRDIELVKYYITAFTQTNSIGQTYKNYSLMRKSTVGKENINKLLQGGSFPTKQGAQRVIENITSFGISAYDDTGTEITSPFFKLPAYVDINISLVTDEALERMSIMQQNVDKGKILNMNEEFITTRIGFRNRFGSSLEY